MKLSSRPFAFTAHKAFLKKQKEVFPVDTGRKLNVCKTFRRRPRRLLKVLCTFNYVLCLRGWTCLPTSFSSLYLKNKYFSPNISHLIFCYMAKFHCLTVFIFWDMGPFVYYNCFPGCNVINFKNKYLAFLSSRFYIWRNKSGGKNKFVKSVKSF